MSDMRTEQKVQSISIEAVVIGPDGKVKKDHGVIAYYNRNPLAQFMWNMKQRLQGKKNGHISGNF